MMFTIVLIIGLLVIFLINRQIKSGRRLRRMVDKFDGPPTRPLIGNILLFMDSPKNIFNRLNQLYQNFHGRPFRLWLFNKPYIFLYKSVDIQEASKILERDSIQGFFSDLLGDGIVTAKPEKWKNTRRLMYSAFNYTALSTNFLEIFNKQSRKVIERFEKDAGTGNTFDVYPATLQCSLLTIYETALGTDTEVDEETLAKFGINIIDGAVLIIKRMARPWLYPTVIFKAYTYLKGYSSIFREIRDFHTKVIRNKIQKMENAAKLGNQCAAQKSMIEILVHKKGCKPLTDNELADELLTLLLAGSETNALTISFTLLMLAMHQDIQDQVYEELSKTFGDDDRDPTIKDLSELSFLEQCIKESLRKFTILPVTVRHATKDIRISDNFTIPSGANITLPFNRVHSDPDLYPDPETWDPHNFDVDRVANRPPHSFLPFGAGPRMCIGYKYAMLSTKAMVSRILRSFKLTTSQTHVELCPDILMRSKNGYNIELHYRCLRKNSVFNN